MHFYSCIVIAVCRYKERVEMALLSIKRGDHRVMSIIIDGMDQNNCKVPYLGSQDTFPAALKQVDLVIIKPQIVI